jgi:hypothetical protein
MSHSPKHFDEITSLFSASCPFGKLSVRHIDVLYTLDSASNYSAIQKLKPCMIANSGYSHEMRRLVCFLFLKQGT